MTGKLTIAVPSKGRIMEQTYEFFDLIGTKIKKPKDREYTGTMGGLKDVEILFMSASEIAAALHGGLVHVGVTGEDLLREKATDPENIEGSIALIKALDFGHADLVLAVPNAWIDVQTMGDLEEVTHDFRRRHHRPLRLATKYSTLTRAFFARHGITDYRIIESSGATEGAPAAGLAEIIVDITSTGATLAANSLRVLSDGIILRSQVQIAAACRAPWSEIALAGLAQITDRIEAFDTARSQVVLQFYHSGNVKRLTAAAQTLAKATGSELLSLNENKGELRCPRSKLYDIVTALRTADATDVTVSDADYIFTRTNPLFERIRPHLTRSPS